MSRHYKAVAASDVDAALADDSCVTTRPRYSLNRTQAITQWTEAQPGGLTHEEARTLVQTADWQAAGDE